MNATDKIKPHKAHQAAAIPFRIRNGKIEFCLVTSSSGRWIFPKGVINENETFVETALIEAEEEAGLRGKVIDGPLGCYDIKKKDGESLTVVAVLMKVTEVDETWKESDWRERRWLSYSKAIKLMPDKELRNLADLAVAAIKNR